MKDSFFKYLIGFKEKGFLIENDSEHVYHQEATSYYYYFLIAD